MPVNSVSETKKGTEKPRYSLSLNRNNGILSNESRKLGDPKENTDIRNTLKLSSSDNKENRPAKRPLNRTYFNTLSAAKRLKPLTETAKITGTVMCKFTIYTKSGKPLL